MENQLPQDNNNAELIITETDTVSAAVIEIENAAIPDPKPAKTAKSPKKPKVITETSKTMETLVSESIRKAEENQLALESRIAIEYKTLHERTEYRFNKMEAFHRELISETRRSTRDVRLFAAIAVVASIAVIIITLIK
ncbi:hypothetical protein FACS1894184_20500 [Clostridia bacterium]|nr:hypothetical protein FACS1894184_20500 [Clostridia bacterium]